MSDLREFAQWDYKSQKEYIRNCIHLLVLAEATLPPVEMPDNLEGVYRFMPSKLQQLAAIDGKDEAWKNWDKFLDQSSIKITPEDRKVIKIVAEEWCPLFPIGTPAARAWKCLYERSRPCRVKTVADRLNISTRTADIALSEGYQTIIRYIISNQP